MDLTPGRCGIPADAPRRSAEEMLETVLEKAREEFPSCPDIFSEDGLKKDDLLQGVRCLSLSLHHPSDVRYAKAGVMHVVCSSSDYSKQKPRKKNVKGYSAKC